LSRANTTEPIDMLFGGGNVIVVMWAQETMSDVGAHWRQLVNAMAAAATLSVDH